MPMKFCRRLANSIKMSRDRIRWTELLDVLTGTDRKHKIVVERATETERMALFSLRREGWSG